MNRLKITLSALFASALTVTSGTAETPIIDADTIHLKNGYSTIGDYPWLAVYIVQPKNIPDLKEISEKYGRTKSHFFNMTADWKRGQSPSGQWHIQTVESYTSKGLGKSTGKPLQYGDAVYLISRQPNAGFLDIADGPYPQMEADKNIPVFTGPESDRTGSKGKSTSIWILRKSASDKSTGTNVDLDQPLHFESANKPGYFLESHNHAHHQNKWFGNSLKADTLFWVSASNDGGHDDSHKWFATLSAETKKNRPATAGKDKSKVVAVEKAYGVKRLHTFGVSGASSKSHYLGMRGTAVGIPDQTDPKSGSIFVLKVQKEGDVAVLQTKAGKYVTAKGSDVVLTDAIEKGSRWAVRNPLKSGLGDGWFSLESASDPGKFLRHYGHIAFAHKKSELDKGQTEHFLADASWKFVDAE